jgi:hypothetical protein
VSIVTGEQMVVIRDTSGVPVFEFPPSQIVSLQWGREGQQVSKCTLATPPLLDSGGNFVRIVPWLHWLEVWSTDMDPVLYWTGPVQEPSSDQFGGQITASDVGVFLAKTRCPITESWDAVDPSIPALAAWQGMLTQQGLDRIVPIQRINPWGQRFDVTLTSDVETLDKTMSEMEQMGLYWSVNAGIPLLGPMPLQPIASLGLAHFAQQGPRVVRDGTTVFNDVLVRGPDNIVRASVPLNGLNLQTIVNLDNMFELTNVLSAAQQYVLYTGSFRTTINVPSGAILVPDAPVTVDQLVPTARYAVEVFGVRVRMQLQSMQCTLTSGQTPQVAVTLVEVPDWTEIGKLLQSGGGLSMVPNAQAEVGTGQTQTTSAVGQQAVVE